MPPHGQTRHHELAHLAPGAFQQIAMENAIHRLILPHDVAVRVDSGSEAQTAAGHVDTGEPGVFQEIAVRPASGVL